MAGYIRQSSFSDGDTITAALFNNEYNQILNAFSNTSGHAHDGTAAEGPVIGLIGDAGETAPNNKVLIDTTNNYIEFYVQVSSSPVQQLYIADGAIVPVTDSDIDLGTTSLRFKDTYTDTVTTTGNVSVGGNLTVTGTTTFNGGTITMGDAATDNVVFGADVDSNIIPDDDDTYDLGSSTQQWRNLYIDGTAEIDTLAINGTTVTSTAAELNILDGVTSTAAELNILDGVTSTAAELNILDGVTSTTAELNILDGVTSTTAELNILDGVTSTAAELNYLDITTLGTTEASKAVTTDANGDILLPDSDKIKFGAGSDLQIYHDGSNSFVADAGTGQLRLLGDDVRIMNAAGTEISAQFIQDGEARLKYDNSTKLATKTGGIEVTGDISNASGDLTLDVAGNISLDADGGYLFLKDGGTTFGQLRNESTDFSIKSITQDKDLIFKGNDGGSEITALTLDMSDAGKAIFNAGAEFASTTLHYGNGAAALVWGDTSGVGQLSFSGNNAILRSTVSDGNLVLQGNDGGSTITALTLDMSDAGTAIFNHDITLPDDGKAIFGAGSDLQIYHDGSNSYIQDTGTGNLYIDATSSIIFRDYGSAEEMAKFINDGAVTLYYDNSAKIATTSSGISVTGEVAATSLDISGDVDVDGTLETDALTIGGVTLAETISDTVGAMVTSNTESGITVAYQDADNTLDFTIGTLNQDTTGTAATVTTAAQPNITSLGTLTTLTVDDITINGSTISDGGDLTIDVGGDIILDAAGSDIKLKKAGTQFGQLYNSSDDFSVAASIQDQDVKIVGNDGGSVITALQLDMSDAGTAIFNHDVQVPDNGKFTAGAGSDLQIYHSSSDNNSYIEESGSGSLVIKADDLYIQNAAGSENMALFVEDGAATLYHNNSAKIATTSTGATTTGLHTSTQSANITQVAITSSSNAVAWDARAAANAYHVTTENTTFSAPSNAVEGAIISVELAQGGTARTVAWNTVFEFAASTAPTVTATANKTDIFSFRYNGSVWQEIGRVQNMAQT